MSPSALPNQDFFENYAEAVLVTEEDTTPVFINAAFTKVSGFDKGKLNLLKPETLFKDADCPPGKLKANVAWETALIRSDSTIVNVYVSVSKIALEDKSEGRVYTIIDNSALARSKAVLRESERRLTATKTEVEELEQELIRTNGELEQFAYVASHDMQEPLRMITSYVQLLQRSIAQDNKKNIDEFMRFVLEAAERMNALIHDLLQFSRVSRKGEHFVRLNLNELVNIAEVHLANQIKASEAKIVVDKLPEIYGDSGQIVRLFQNLLDNALKFRSPDRIPEIKISGEKRESDCLFSVSDNGIGIGDKYFDRIFVIFQRLHSRTEYEGTGIGLAVCKKIVERHGGEIWVESETGKGSTFYFTLKNNLAGI